jgi:hypothetical protein
MSYAISIVTTVLLGIFYSWTSRLNGMFFFGRTADAAVRQSEDGRAITREYLTGVLLTTIAAVVLAWEGGHLGHRTLGGVALLLEAVTFWAIFARANGRVRRLVQSHNSATPSRDAVIQVALLEQPTYWIPGVSAILLPLAASVGALGAAVLLAGHGAGFGAGWNAWNASMDGAGDAGMLGLATGLLVASAGLLIVFRSSARMRTKMAQYTVQSSVALEWIGTALFLTVLACNHFGVVISRGAGKGVILAALIVALGMFVWNQARSKQFTLPPVELGADDRWRWGLFYVDRNDPALFVQSRCGAGYTLNYGRVAAWPISVGLLAYVVGVLFFLPHVK